MEKGTGKRSWESFRLVVETLDLLAKLRDLVGIVLLGVTAAVVALVSLVIGNDITVAALNKPNHPMHKVIVQLLMLYGFVFALGIVGSAVALFYLSRYKRTKRHLKQEKELSERYKACGDDFLRLSYHNAKADKAAFDELLRPLKWSGDIPTIGRTEMSLAIANAEKQIRENILDNLDFLKLIADNFLKGQCAVNVKLVTIENVGQRGEPVAVTKTVARDRYSAPRRAHRDGVVIRVDEDTAHEFVLIGKGPVYRADGLSEKKDYLNHRAEWDQHYDSIVVCGIQSHVDGNNTIAYRGLLTVDSKSVNVDHDTIDYHAREIANRLSILLYRLEMIAKLKDRALTK